MAFPLTNRVYAITGAASGMGLATTQLLLARGAIVSVCDLNASSPDKLPASLPPDQSSRIFTTPVNVTDRAALHSWLHATKSKCGKIDGIANFASTGGHHLGAQSVWETTDEEFNFIVSLNIKGLFNLLAEALHPSFLAPGASIVHISSMYSERGYLKGAVFAASKHAAVGLVKSAAIEAGEAGVRVNIVMPGSIDTPMLHYVKSLSEGGAHDVPGTPIRRFGMPGEVAGVVAFLMGEECGFVTGSCWGIDAGGECVGDKKEQG